MSKVKEKIKLILKDKDQRNLYINILLAFVIKGVSLIISVFSMPLYMRYFSNESVLGVWYTILSVLTWITVCDLGLGRGLRNRLTEAISNKDDTAKKEYISSTYILLTLIIVPVSIIICVLFCFIDLNFVFKIETNLISVNNLRISIIILFLGVAINFVLKSVNSIIYAIQKSSINNFLSLITSVIPLVFILLYNSSGNIEIDFITLSVVHVLAINLPLLIATFFVFYEKQLKGCFPSIKYYNKKIAKDSVAFGLQFFLAQMFFMAIMSTNEFYITSLFSSADVVEYSIYYKLFTVVGSLFMLALTPLWSKITKDYCEGNYLKIKKTNRFLYIISAIALVIEFLMVPFLQFIVNIWLQEEAILVSIPVALTFALFGSVYIFNVVLTTVANGIGELKSQIYFYGVGCVLKIGMCLLFKQIISHWSIVVLANIIILSCFCIYQIFWIEKRINLLIKSASCINKLNNL